VELQQLKERMELIVSPVILNGKMTISLKLINKHQLNQTGKRLELKKLTILNGLML
jgi:hypothetical protein